VEELTKALEVVLVVTITLGIPVVMLFAVGCLIQYREVLQRFFSRLIRWNDEKGAMPSA
jgi:hypothetical protein